MAKKLKPIIIRGKRPSLRKTAATMGIGKKKLAKIKKAVKELFAQKLTPKEIRKRSGSIRAKLEELNLKIIEFRNKALYAEKEEERWQKRLWKLQFLCPHRNRQSSREESEARDLPYNKHAWLCRDCGFSNWYDNDKEFEKELEKLLATQSKQKAKTQKARS
jgi:hypothetical protein